MCDLCGTVEEAKAGRARAMQISKDLARLSNLYAATAYGSIKPHTDEAKKIELAARLAVRALVEDWV